MCGRFSLTTSRIDEVVAAVEAVPTEQVRRVYRPRWNIAPGDRHPIVVERGGRHMVVANWGFPLARGSRSTVNARMESAATKPSFSEAWAQARCVVVSDGFYEWGDTPAGRRPHRVSASDGGFLLLAGLFTQTRDERGRHLHFCILTTEPNAEVGALHERMPLIVPPNALQDWLSGDPPAAGQVPFAPTADGALEVREVSRAVNDPAIDDERCWAAPTPDAQGELF